MKINTINSLRPVNKIFINIVQVTLMIVLLNCSNGQDYLKQKHIKHDRHKIHDDISSSFFHSFNSTMGNIVSGIKKSALAISLSSTMGQASSQTFHKCYGIDKSTYGRDLIELGNEGNLFVVGYTSEIFENDLDCYGTLLEDDGSIINTVTFGTSDTDKCMSTISDSQGSIITTGSIQGAGQGKKDAAVFFHNSNLGLERSCAFGGSDTDEIQTSLFDQDGNVIHTGYTKSAGAGKYDAFVYKTNSTSCDEICSVTIGGSNDESFYHSFLHSSGKIINLGSTKSYGPGYFNCFISVTDSDCNELWSAWMGGDGFEVCTSGTEDEDGNIVATGYATSERGWYVDVLFGIWDINGNFIGTPMVKGDTDSNLAYQIQRLDNGNFFMVGKKNTIDSYKDDIFYSELYPNFTDKHTYYFGGSGDQEMYGLHISKSSNPTMVGHSDSYTISDKQLLVLKLPEDGNTGCSRIGSHTISPALIISQSSINPSIGNTNFIVTEFQALVNTISLNSEEVCAVNLLAADTGSSNSDSSGDINNALKVQRIGICDDEYSDAKIAEMDAYCDTVNTSEDIIGDVGEHKERCESYEDGKSKGQDSQESFDEFCSSSGHRLVGYGGLVVMLHLIKQLYN